MNQQRKQEALLAAQRQQELREQDTKVCEEQKQNMEDTMLELLEEVKNIIEQEPKRRARLTKCLDNFKVIHNKSSISLNNSSQISLVIAIAPVLPTEELEYSFSMGDEHLNTTLGLESDKIIKSSVENLVPIPNIEFIEASLLDYELVSLEEVNDVYQEEKENDLKDILQIQDVILREKLLSVNRLIVNIEFLNDKPTPDHVLKSPSSFPILVTDSDTFFKKSDTSLSYSNNSLPKFETFNDHTEETKSGSTTTQANNSLPEYDSFHFKIEPHQGRLTSIVMDKIFDNLTNDPLLEAVDSFLVSDNTTGYDPLLLPENESSNFDHHNDPSFPRPPPKPPDVEVFFDFDPDSG
nr:hypothetical protein [Tanacetum cinerariifolium]